MKLIANMMVYNERPFLSEVIPALHRMCNKLVVVDNGSTDGTIEELERLLLPDDELIYARQGDPPDFGKQRNIALDATEEGAWILKWDADELPSEAMVEGLRNRLILDQGVHTGWAIGCYHIMKQPRTCLAFEAGFQHLCLFRKDHDVRWREGTHEQIMINDPWGGINPKLTGMAIIHFSYWCEKRFARKALQYTKIPGSGFTRPEQLTDRLKTRPVPIPDSVLYKASKEWLETIKEIE
jgi:glycosyltransferase involved in cell wall biosynthesis